MTTSGERTGTGPKHPFWHKVWRVTKPLLEVLVALVVLVGLMAIPLLKGENPSVGNNLSGIAAAPLATTGPLIGDVSAFATENACMEQLVKDPANNLLGYPPVIGAPEHTDAIHSGVYPCATWTGDSKGPNQVFEYQSETTYDGGIQFVTFGSPYAGYLIGGGLGSPSSGSYVSRFNPATGKEQWRTYIQQVNLDGQWIAFGSMAVGENGDVYAAAGADLWRMDPDTGEVLAHVQQPILGNVTAKDSNFDGWGFAPDGTILLKTQTRSPGCPTQGNLAMSSCTADYGPQPHTTVIAADPITLENIDAIELPQEVTARPIITTYQGTIYMYMAGTTTGVRVEWDPDTQKLTYDSSWAPKYLLDGQTVGDAPAAIGDWIIFNQNAGFSTTVPICVVVVNQADQKDLQRLCPWGKTLPAGDNQATTSWSGASFGTDPANSMIYVQDTLVQGIYGVHLDQSSGDLKVVWSRPDIWMADYYTMVGPTDQRVLLTQNLGNPTPANVFVEDYNYQETLMWLDASTGDTLAETTPHASTAVGSLINIGSGGRVYMMGNQGSLFIFQVAACSDLTSFPPGTTCPTTSSSPTQSASASPGG